MVIKIGQIISHYKILSKLGAGGMGEVYLAEDTKLPRKVALKFLAQAYADFPEFKARFKREAEAAAAIRHPNIIVIHEIGEFANRPYFVMEYIEGESLGELIARKELQVHEVIDILIQFCEGLKKAHQQGVIHRDVKPSNILIDHDGLVKIVDFGLAKLRDGSKITEEGARMGTIPYMSPEQDLGQELDQRSDIFSLGVVLYELITRRLPFQGAPEAISYARLHLEPEPLARYKRGVSEGLQRILDKALDKDRDTRYQNVESILADLKKERKLFSSLPSSTVSMPPVTPPKPETRRRRKLLPALSAVVVILLAGLAAYLYFGQKPPVNKPVLPEKAPVSISSNPAGATVFRNGDSIGVTPLNISAMDGETIKLRIRKSNYYAIDTTIVARTGQDSTFSFSLIKLPAPSISSIPPKISRVGVLEITSSPAGAAIRLDGREAGLTPKTIRDLDAGIHQISLRKKGYKADSVSARVIAGQVLPLDFKLTALPGTLKVTVKPYGAIFIDGKLYEENTRQLFTQELPPGTYRLRVVNPDSGAWEKSVNIESEALLEIQIDFTKTYKLTITSTPILGEIFVDGKYRGSAPKSLTLRAGQHTIEARREGYEGEVKVINLENDWQEPLKLILRKIP